MQMLLQINSLLPILQPWEMQCEAVDDDFILEAGNCTGSQFSELQLRNLYYSFINLAVNRCLFAMIISR